MATKTAVQRPRIHQLYLDSVRDELKKELNLSNINQVPKLEKIVVNVGVGRSKGDNRMKETVINTLRKITGQQPAETKSRKSIAGFKLREGEVVGYRVTLRGARMYEFLDRVVSIVLPRVRDFHGVSIKSFDPQGNYSIGIKEQSIFPELTFEDTAVLHGLQINIVTTAEDKESSKALLRKLGVPLQKENK
ncbi:TPA: 50S ribosomal protein L5 [Candidatus Saccharibacteria bacterium]|nr:50S ribosomal protein L5 [Candidatus Saccharibacteria bacterium]HIO87388.1 50S ribosomal protein L5 [Candidatus Saccharibacteria bacterium]